MMRIAIAQPVRPRYSRAMAIAPHDLIASPDHYLHSFDGDEAVFVPMDAAAYRRSIFLDARISPASEGALGVPVGQLAAERLPKGPPMGWIFHVAHCGSTLLARAIEALAGNLVLKEPAALRQLGFAPDDERLDIVLALLARRYEASAMTIVKANVPVNFLLSDIAARRPDDAAIVLYWGLEDYLTAILRSDNHRQWLRGITTHFAGHLGLGSDASDAERAAALWKGQVERFGALKAAMPRTVSLDAGRLFADPRGVLCAAAQHFGIETTGANLDAVMVGGLFKTYSKRPDIAFDNTDRLARAEAVSSAIGDEIAAAHAWFCAQGDSSAELEARLTKIALA
ncbi:MAG: hypothetical protein ACKOPQ_06775 [Novosphingobium sp.]